MVKQYYKTNKYGQNDLSSTKRAMEATQRFTAQWNSSIAAQTQLQDKYNIRNIQDLERFLTELYDRPKLQDKILRECVV